MAITTILNENRRLSILHCLGAMDDYSANHSIIQTVCSSYGNSMTSDVVVTHLAWLAEQDLVTLSHVGDYTVATLTNRGADVERGLARVPGVKRPGPKR